MAQPAAPKSCHILLVEDNAADVRLTREVLRNSTRPVTLHVAKDGEQALAMLGRQGVHRALPEPDLILLDLNLPRMPGREVLAQLKACGTLRHIPVIVLSTSRSDGDVAACYQLHANCYLQKPIKMESFATTMRQIEEFWLQRVALPPKGAAEYHENPAG
jgi:two-component system, chemotaxis family, response regulator Rcp1